MKFTFITMVSLLFAVNADEVKIFNKNLGIISNIELLTESELASGIPIPNNAPENEIEAERFPSLINFNSFIGVKKI